MMNITAVWGVWGCLWRFLVYLLGIVIFSILIFQLKKCNKGEDATPSDLWTSPDSPGNVGDSIVTYRPDSIPGVDELPNPDNNYIPPFDSTAVIVNPDDSLSYIIDNQLFVFFNAKDIKADMASFAKQFKAAYPDAAYQIVHYDPTIATMLIEVPQGEVIRVRDELPQKIKGVDFMAFTNNVWTSLSAPSDPGFSEPNYDEYFKLIQAYDAWDVTRGDSSVTVAVIDFYFDLTHPEISDRCRLPFNVPARNNQVGPPPLPVFGKNQAGAYSHGTHVAGIAIGGQNNQLGCSGIAPKCSWIPISVGDSPTDISIVEGIMFAVYHGANVINISLGAQFPDWISLIPIEDQVGFSIMPHKRDMLWDYILRTAEAHHCTIVTAAGNESILLGMDVMNRDSLMVTVENVDRKGKKADSSNFGIVRGYNVDYQSIAAPGVDIWSSSYKPALPVMKASGYKVSEADGFQEMTGTSMASPCVAGAIALMKTKNKDLSTSDIIKILRATGKQTDTSGLIGPTIQLRDALDMVGGERMSFTDVMQNHDLIIGKWKSTSTLQITDGKTGNITDEVWDYFTFTSTSEGYIEDCCIRSSKVYTADLSVTWRQGTIEINQLSGAKTKQPPINELKKYNYVCRPDKNGLLEATGYQNGEKQFTFYLEKVK